MDKRETSRSGLMESEVRQGGREVTCHPGHLIIGAGRAGCKVKSRATWDEPKRVRHEVPF
ncbi:hypothetical protein ColLi_02563 [Colletotrichum liriopes]|uniref:Uncharacterized protein n=1 Tax=Colletotrichum liriopes TaxID=708192 RepID=A0AA37GFK4_9PEZI|nr:hypothetical protein ColLi_02563 [Colletotrichum liriopes]